MRFPSDPPPRTGRIIRLGLLVAAALATNLAESLVPLPLPGAKLGIANAFPLIALLLWGPREATIVMALRVALGGLLSGNALATAATAAGATAALAVMLPLRRAFGADLSVPMLSVAGATAYNLAQTAVVAALVGDFRLLLLFPPLGLLGVGTGWGIGLLAERTAARVGVERGEDRG
jgi:heptaprenyl diphosphate synthase